MDYYDVPEGSGTRVLIGDLTALPGIVRILADAVGRRGVPGGGGAALTRGIP